MNLPTPRFRHIAVEGAIGAGKTTLALALARVLDARVLLERPEDNPFLEKFYADRARYALPTQLSFLIQRVEQARELAQAAILSPLVVSDFMFSKDDLFARLTLSDDEYRLYRRVSDDLAPAVAAPDLVVWLRATGATLRDRVARRGRAMERDLEARDLEALDAQYAAFFARCPEQPLLSIDTAAIDFVADEAAVHALAALIATFEGPREHVDSLRVAVDSRRDHLDSPRDHLDSPRDRLDSPRAGHGSLAQDPQAPLAASD